MRGHDRQLFAVIAILLFAIATVLAAGWFGAHGNAAPFGYGGLVALVVAVWPGRLV